MKHYGLCTCRECDAVIQWGWVIWDVICALGLLGVVVALYRAGLFSWI